MPRHQLDSTGRAVKPGHWVIEPYLCGDKVFTRFSLVADFVDSIHTRIRVRLVHFFYGGVDVGWVRTEPEYCEITTILTIVDSSLVPPEVLKQGAIAPSL